MAHRLEHWTEAEIDRLVATDVVHLLGIVLLDVLRHQADDLRIGLRITLVAVRVERQACLFVRSDLPDVGLQATVGHRHQRQGSTESRAKSASTSSSTARSRSTATEH